VRVQIARKWGGGSHRAGVAWRVARDRQRTASECSQGAGTLGSWRVDVLSDAGERDSYRLGSRSYLWDSGEELLTEV
jgi:hypothetical protein